MNLNEVVKSFLVGTKDTKPSSDVKPEHVIDDLTDIYPTSGSFFDDNQYGGMFGGDSDATTILLKQKERIMKYRNLARATDVTDAIDEIVNEIIFTYDDTMPVKVNVEDDNEKLVSAITDKFKKITKLLNIKRNMYNIVKTSYVDGQIVLHTSYNEKNTKEGIQAIKMIDPCMLYFDNANSTYRYLSEDRIMGAENKQQYSVEEICRENFGIRDGNINLSYLEDAIKPANMLTTLEDLLIPMRFSRSISRRVFNVDIGELPGKRGAEVMRDYQNKFKYKKFYNNATGEVSNQQHITSMVEDYWFANRSGGKGTTVDVLDESGNLGELDDILYFYKKLYKALKIPSNRINMNMDGDKEFGYDETRTSKEDMKFFMFISRIRQMYSSLFKELLKREIISTKTMTEEEWDIKEDDIKISFTNENKFIEKMKLENFMSKLDIYSTAQEYQGKLFSVETILKDIFRFTEDEIDTELKKIKKEEKDKKYENFYKGEEDY